MPRSGLGRSCWLWAAVVARVAAPPVLRSQLLASQRRLASTAAPAQAPAPQAGYVGSDTCVTCHTDQEASIKGTKHGAGEESAVAGGDERVRELPRPRAGARRRRRQGAHPEVRRDEARGGQPDVPHLPQPRHARRLGGQRARRAQPVVHDLPQRAQPEVGGTPAGEADRDAALRDVPPAAGDQDRAGRGAHAGARRQDVVHRRATTRTARSATSRT